MKKLVRGVVLNNLSDSVSDISDRYQLLKVVLDDNLMQEIMNEGQKYKYSKDRILNEVKQAGDRINFTPGRYTDYNTLKLSNLPIGQHLIFHFSNQELGAITISTITLNSRMLMILEPAIGGLCYKDVIEPISPELHIGVKQLFKVYRDGVLVTHEYDDYCPGKLVKIDYYHPSTIFELMDIDNDYVKNNDPITAQDDKPTTAQKDKKNIAIKPANNKASKSSSKNCHLVWFPRQKNPLSWVLTNADKHPNAPFKIEFYDRGELGRIYINPAFKFNDNEQIRIFEQTNIQECTVGYEPTPRDVQLVTMTPGVVKYNPTSKTWELTKKPIISGVQHD